MTTIVSFRVKESDKKKLDKVARSQDRDRSYIINQAIALYLEMHKEKVDRIKEAQKQVEDGNICDENQWRKVFKR